VGKIPLTLLADSKKRAITHAEGIWIIIFSEEKGKNLVIKVLAE